MLKNFTFKIKEQQNYVDYNSRNYFFSEVSGEFYQINRISNKTVRFHQTFDMSNRIKNSHRPIDFSTKSSGVRVGKYFWIVGGNEDRIFGQITSEQITQRQTKLYNIKKSVWINGPKLPKSIWLYHASATAINSSHVVFVGANSYFDEECKKSICMKCMVYRTNELAK